MNHPTPSFGNHAKERTAPDQPLNAGAVRKPSTECRECDGEGMIYGFATIDPGEKENSKECPRCDGSGHEPEWKPNEDMIDEAEHAYDNIHDMDVPVSAYCEAILIACRPLIIAEYEESKNVFDK